MTWLTQPWVTLIVAAMGFVATIVGVMITQRRSDRREDKNWERERERERARWAREEAARTFEQRQEAYAEFYESLREMTRTVYDHGVGLSEGSDLPLDWNLPTFRKLQHLELYASTEVANFALAAYFSCRQWGHNAVRGQDDEQFRSLQQLTEQDIGLLLDALRADLGVRSRVDPTSIDIG